MSKGLAVGLAGVSAAVAVVIVLAMPDRSGTGTPIVTLQPRDVSGRAIAAGMPLLLEVLLSGTRHAPGPSLGGWLTPWHELIAVSASREGTSIELAVIETGVPRVRELTAAAGDRSPTIREGTSRAARLDGLKRIYRVALAISPDETGRLTPGVYEMKAVLETPWWQVWAWRGRAESRPLRIEVGAARPPAERLAATAQFLLETGRLEEAIRVAREWGASDAQSAPARLLLGDALLETGQRQAAQDAYEDALTIANARESREPPRIIFERLARVRRSR